VEGTAELKKIVAVTSAEPLPPSKWKKWEDLYCCVKYSCMRERNFAELYPAK